MKKLAFMVMVACGLFQTAKANNENLIYALPVHMAQNVNIDDATCILDIYISTTSIAGGVNFDILIPDGIIFDPEYYYKGKDVLPYTSKRGVDTFPHTISVKEYPVQDMEGYTRYLVNIFDMNGSKFTATDGVLLSFDLGSTATAAGVKPILINNQACFYDGSTQIFSQKSSTSYVVFDGASEATLSVVSDGTNSVELGEAVVEALASETAIKTLDLTGASAINGDFTYVDGRAVTAPADELEVSAKYAKTLAQGKYASLTLPFDATFGDETAYKFMEVEGDYAKFDAVNSANAGDVVLLTKSVNLTGSKLSSVAGATVDKAYYVSADGSELRQGTNVNVPALRGVWEIEGANSNLRIMLDGIATDIKMADLEGEGAQAFDLQGRRTANAKNGVYVVNGKKQIVK